MAVIAEFTAPTHYPPFGPAFAAVDYARLTIEQFVPIANDPIPYFWIHTDDLDAFFGALRLEPLIEELNVLERFDDVAIFRIDWIRLPPVADLLEEYDLTLLSAEATENEWTIALRADTHEPLREFNTELNNDDELDFHLDHYYSQAKVKSGPEYDLTEKQLRALVAAYEQGYFDEPRGASLEDLGDEFEISTRSFSRRYKRAVKKLVERTLL